MTDTATIVVTIVVALIAAMPPSILAYAALRTSRQNVEKLGDVELKIDGRLTELLLSSGRDQRAQGVVEGRGEQAQLQVQTATPVPHAEPLQVQVVPDADAPLPVTVVEPDT